MEIRQRAAGPPAADGRPRSGGPRRTMWVGLPTVLTILSNRGAPSLLDAYLARTNVKGQQSPDHDHDGQRRPAGLRCVHGRGEREVGDRLHHQHPARR